MAVENMYQRLQNQEEIAVTTAPDHERDFRIRPYVWGGAVLGYSVVGENGRVVRGYRGIMLDKQAVEIWADSLDERAWCDQCQGHYLPHEHEQEGGPL